MLKIRLDVSPDALRKEYISGKNWTSGPRFGNEAYEANTKT